MRKSFAAALGATFAPACLLVAAPVALADVKAGVDAWNQGDYGRAIAEWRPLAIAGNADAQFNLGQAYKLGRGVPVDLPVALEWFRKAAEQGHEKGSDNYGLLLYQQGRLDDSMPYIQASAARGEPRAQYVYATALFNGDVVQKDWVRAYALMTRAAQAGVTQATSSLEQMDRYIPEAQRRDGLALASAIARGPVPTGATTPAPQLAQQATPPAPASAPRTSAPPPVRQPAPTPAATPAPPTPAPAVIAAGPEARPPVTKRNPRPQPVPVAATSNAGALPPAASGRYRVQLGAFREEGRAPALWRNVSGQVSGLSAFRPSYVVTNGLTRLLVGPLSSAADAQRLCARIKVTGTPCVVQGN